MPNPQPAFTPCEPRADAPRRLNIYGPADPGRAEVEDFIRRVFAERYGATVQEFAPVLVGLCDPEQGLVAAAGYRGADGGALFLERYLAAPVEQLLAPHSVLPLRRAGVVEVGHLAATRAGEGRRLILQMGPHLAARGYEWVVSTLTSELRHLFLRIGVTPLALGAADPDVLGEGAAQWGRYYEHQPVVLAGHLPQTLLQLARRRAGAQA